MQKISLNWFQHLYPDIAWKNFDPKIEFTSVQNDSRKVSPGALFFALAGTKEQGEKYIEEAIQQGAVAVIAEVYTLDEVSVPCGITPKAREVMAHISYVLCNEPAKAMRVVGITGTNGKTTTSFFMRSIFQAAGYATGLLGTTGYYYGGQCYPASHTTPDALVLHGHFAQMRDQGISHVVMEVSSHSLVQDRVAEIMFAAAIFTNLSRDHLDFHKDMDNYREAKALLFRKLASSALAVFNADDPASFLIQSVCRAKPLFFAITCLSKAVLYAQNIVETPSHTKFQFITPDGVQNCKIYLPGQYNVYNALAASSCAWGLGISMPTIAQGLEQMRYVPGRMQRIENDLGIDVFVDFAHTDQALERALQTLSAIKQRRILLVFGCGGDRDRGKRPMMGKVAEKYADYTWITNDNPRSESPESIANAIAQGFTEPTKYYICLDRKTAIAQALQTAQPKDIVLIAGKGHENTQIIGHQTFPFSDADVAKDCLRDLQSTGLW